MRVIGEVGQEVGEKLNPVENQIQRVESMILIFIIAGIVSFMHAKQVKIDAEAEDKLIEEILAWAKDNISKELLDEGLDLSEPEEILYFSRADKIKDLLMHQFENADEALIYEYTEQIYQNIYE